MNSLLPIAYLKNLCPSGKIVIPLPEKTRSAKSKCSRSTIMFVLEAFGKYPYSGPSSFNAYHHDFSCSSFSPGAESSANQNCLTWSRSRLMRENIALLYTAIPSGPPFLMQGIRAMDCIILRVSGSHSFN